MAVPVIDIGPLRQSPEGWSLFVHGIGKVCRENGFFQAINHGICPFITSGHFFALPPKEKMGLLSSDVTKPLRYSTDIKDGSDSVQLCRAFLKHYTHPLAEWIKQWSFNPPDYREKMGRYCIEVRRLALEVMGAIMESLGLGPTYLSDKLEEGMRVMALNCYLPCLHPNLTLGLPPHSDYNCITVVLQNCPGLQVKGLDGDTWTAIPELEGSLQFHVGDHLEVLSNGRYKRVKRCSRKPL